MLEAEGCRLKAQWKSKEIHVFAMTSVASRPVGVSSKRANAGYNTTYRRAQS